MKTKKIPTTRYGFYFFEKTKDLSLPLVVWPSVWVEHRRQGLEIDMKRITLGWLHYRLTWYLGRVIPPSVAPLNAPVHGLDDFFSWAQEWSKSTWRRSEFDQWLQHSEWKTLVRWGGARYHYSRIVLAKEFLSSQHGPSSSPVVGDVELSIGDLPSIQDQVNQK